MRQNIKNTSVSGIAQTARMLPNGSGRVSQQSTELNGLKGFVPQRLVLSYRVLKLHNLKAGL